MLPTRSHRPVTSVLRFGEMRRQTFYTSGAVGHKTTHVRYIKIELIGTQPLIVKSKARIIFNIEFKTSFRYT